jgi:signal peptide peptidase SppA
MKLYDLVTSPWAMVPEKLLEIQAIYATHLRGEKIDIEAVEMRLQRPLANDQQEYTVRDGGVAVLPIEGTIAPKANLFTRVSGGASAQMLQTQLESAMADARVKAIVLAIDSPGGSVFGIYELAASIEAYAKEKPIVALCDAQIASAAYLIGSAANAVLITGPAVMAGSIGVVMNHQFTPDFRGGQVTEITAGKYKRIASSNAPLSAEGRAYMQEMVDHYYSVFVDAVARHRGASAELVLERMADGRIFIGQQAIDAGLVDGVSTLDALVEQLAADPQAYTRRRIAKPKPAAAESAAEEGATPELEEAGAAAESDSTPTVEQESTMTQMTREALERDHPALFASLRTELTATGAQTERDRIAAVRAQSLPGHEALIEAMANDGKTTGPEAAAAVLAAERNVRKAQAQAHADDAPKPAPHAAAPSAEQPAAEDKSLPVEERAKAAWASDPKLRTEFASQDDYVAWLRADEAGKVRVLRKA